VGEKKDLCPGKKFYNSKPTEATEPEVLRNAKQCLFMLTPSKKAKKCQTMTYVANTIFHAKQLQRRPNFWNLALKMPTRQPWFEVHKNQG